MRVVPSGEISDIAVRLKANKIRRKLKKQETLGVATIAMIWPTFGSS